MTGEGLNDGGGYPCWTLSYVPGGSRAPLLGSGLRRNDGGGGSRLVVGDPDLGTGRRWRYCPCWRLSYVPGDSRAPLLGAGLRRTDGGCGFPIGVGEDEWWPGMPAHQRGHRLAAAYSYRRASAG